MLQILCPTKKVLIMKPFLSYDISDEVKKSHLMPYEIF